MKTLLGLYLKRDFVGLRPPTSLDARLRGPGAIRRRPERQGGVVSLTHRDFAFGDIPARLRRALQ